MCDGEIRDWGLVCTRISQNFAEFRRPINLLLLGFHESKKLDINAQRHSVDEEQILLKGLEKYCEIEGGREAEELSGYEIYDCLCEAGCAEAMLGCRHSGVKALLGVRTFSSFFVGAASFPACLLPTPFVCPALARSKWHDARKDGQTKKE